MVKGFKWSKGSNGSMVQKVPWFKWFKGSNGSRVQKGSKVQ